MPHRFSVPMPDDVDYRILLTFLELYEVQLKFVLFKLYNDHGLAYPPVLDEGADMAGVMLVSPPRQSVPAAAVAHWWPHQPSPGGACAVARPVMPSLPPLPQIDAFLAGSCALRPPGPRRYGCGRRLVQRRL